MTQECEPALYISMVIEKYHNFINHLRDTLPSIIKIEPEISQLINNPALTTFSSLMNLFEKIGQNEQARTVIDKIRQKINTITEKMKEDNKKYPRLKSIQKIYTMARQELDKNRIENRTPEEKKRVEKFRENLEAYINAEENRHNVFKTFRYIMFFIDVLKNEEEMK